jgi:hypothetical protein
MSNLVHESDDTMVELNNLDVMAVSGGEIVCVTGEGCPSNEHGSELKIGF